MTKIPQVKVNMENKIEKSLIAGAAASTGLMGWAAKAYAAFNIINIPNEQITNADTSLQQHRETISLIPAAVKAGAMTPEEAIDYLNLMLDDVRRLERSLKTSSTISTKAKSDFEYVNARLIRANKLKIAIATSQGQIIQYANNPQQMNAAELNLALNTLLTAT